MSFFLYTAKKRPRAVPINDPNDPPNDPDLGDGPSKRTAGTTDPRKARRTRGRTERPCADGRQDGRQGRQGATPKRPQDGRTGCAYTHDGRQARHDGRHAGRPTPLARAMMEETQKAVSERPPQRHAGRTAGTIAGRKASCAGTDARQDGTTLKAVPHIVRNATPDGRQERPARTTHARQLDRRQDGTQGKLCRISHGATLETRISDRPETQ